MDAPWEAHLRVGAQAARWALRARAGRAMPGHLGPLTVYPEGLLSTSPLPAQGPHPCQGPPAEAWKPHVLRARTGLCLSSMTAQGASQGSTRLRALREPTTRAGLFEQAVQSPVRPTVRPTVPTPHQQQEAPPRRPLRIQR